MISLDSELAQAITGAMRSVNGPLTSKEIFDLALAVDDPQVINKALYDLRKRGIVTRGQMRLPGEPGCFAGRGERPVYTYLLQEQIPMPKTPVATAAPVAAPACEPVTDLLLAHIDALPKQALWDDASLHAERLRALADSRPLAEQTDIGLWLHGLATRIEELAR